MNVLYVLLKGEHEWIICAIEGWAWMDSMCYWRV